MEYLMKKVSTYILLTRSNLPQKSMGMWAHVLPTFLIGHFPPSSNLHSTWFSTKPKVPTLPVFEVEAGTVPTTTPVEMATNSRGRRPELSNWDGNKFASRRKILQWDNLAYQHHSSSIEFQYTTAKRKKKEKWPHIETWPFNWISSQRVVL